MNPAAKTILIADDDASIRLVLSQTFSRLGHPVRATGNVATLLKWVGEGEGDLVITDVVLPDENVFEVLPRIRRLRPALPIIVISARNTLLTAVSAAEVGVFDYLPKPFDLDDIAAAARRALAKPPASALAKARVRAERDERLPLIGGSAAMQQVYRTISRLVGSDLTVLLQGESGTGKSLVARALHDLGPRRDGPFVVMSLGSAPRERIDSELFGDGAGGRGRLVEADGGTLLLDEIGDMPLDAQTRLLRLFEGSDAPLDTRTGRKPEPRIIAATSRDLRTLVSQGLFRGDLFFRLDVASVSLPPLRDRTEDIPDLARAFLLRAAREGLATKAIDEEALERLAGHDWPGNVRELENMMRRVCALYSEAVVSRRIVERELVAMPTSAGEAAPNFARTLERHLAQTFAGAPDSLPPPGLYHRFLEEVERPLFATALKATGGNQLRAAEVLGLNRNTLRKRLTDLGMSAR